MSNTTESHEKIMELMEKDFEPHKEKFNVQLPPTVFVEMGCKFVEYVRKKSLTVSCPVSKKLTNPLGNMQGGIIATAFDNTMGPLSFLVAGKPTVTLNLDVNYVRPIQPGDTLTITARITARGLSTMQMVAEGFNNKHKLIATASTNILIINMPGS